MPNAKAGLPSALYKRPPKTVCLKRNRNLLAAQTDFDIFGSRLFDFQPPAWFHCLTREFGIRIAFLTGNDQELSIRSLRTGEA